MKPRTNQPTKKSTHETMKSAPLCQFVSMFAKASCARRKRWCINDLRLGRQSRAWCPGYKKLQSQLGLPCRELPAIPSVLVRTNCPIRFSSLTAKRGTQAYNYSRCRDGSLRGLGGIAMRRYIRDCRSLGFVATVLML